MSIDDNEDGLPYVNPQELPGSAFDRVSPPAKFGTPGQVFNPDQDYVRLIPHDEDVQPLTVANDAMFIEAFLASDEPLIPISIQLACCRDHFFADSAFVREFPRVTHRAWGYIEGMMRASAWSDPTAVYEHPQVLTFERHQEKSGWLVESDDFFGTFFQCAMEYQVMSTADLRAKYFRNRRLLDGSVPDSIVALVSWAHHTRGNSFFVPLIAAATKFKLSPDYFKWLVRALSFVAGAVPSDPAADTDPTYGERNPAIHLSLPMARLG